MYCQASKIAAKIFKGKEDDAGRIHYRLYEILDDLHRRLPEDIVNNKFFIASVCLDWESSNPGERMFGE